MELCLWNETVLDDARCIEVLEQLKNNSAALRADLPDDVLKQASTGVLEISDAEGKYKGSSIFTPALQTQRNQYAFDTLLELRKATKLPIKKLVVLGCGRFSFERYLLSRFRLCMLDVSCIISVDIDATELAEGVAELKETLKASVGDFEYKVYSPVEWLILRGDAKQFHNVFKGADAVISLEVIEHMEISDADVFVENILQNIQPRYAILSTPNRDFNRFFRENPFEFRHPDHKFEFSEREFTCWVARHAENNPLYSSAIEYVGYLDFDGDDDDGDPVFADGEPVIRRSANEEYDGGATQIVYFERAENCEPSSPKCGCFFVAFQCTLPYGLEILVESIAIHCMTTFLRTKNADDLDRVEKGAFAFSEVNLEEFFACLPKVCRDFLTEYPARRQKALKFLCSILRQYTSVSTEPVLSFRLVRCVPPSELLALLNRHLCL